MALILFPKKYLRRRGDKRGGGIRAFNIGWISQNGSQAHFGIPYTPNNT